MYDFVRYFDRIAPECKVRSYGTPQASYRASVNGIHRGFGDSGNKRGRDPPECTA